jgi:hypothetical protein
MLSCMGGWCMQRNSCAYYWAVAPIIVERLCESGQTDVYARVATSVPRQSADPDANCGPSAGPRLAGGMVKGEPAVQPGA